MYIYVNAYVYNDFKNVMKHEDINEISIFYKIAF